MCAYCSLAIKSLFTSSQCKRRTFLRPVRTAIQRTVSFFWTGLWKRNSSAKSGINSETGSDDEGEANELPATANKGSETAHNPLCIADKRISPGRQENSEVCWLRWKACHPRKRLKMFMRRMAEKRRKGVGKEILVTTTIEVTTSPAPLSSPIHVAFSDDPSVSLFNLGNNEHLDGLGSTGEPIFSPPHGADAKAGAERSHQRRHSIPCASLRPLSFFRLPYLGARPRSSYHTEGFTDSSILFQEAEWGEYLERATLRSATSCGTYESEGKQSDLGAPGLGKRKQTSRELEKGFLERLGLSDG
jgi:hypothetical protein